MCGPKSSSPLPHCPSVSTRTYARPPPLPSLNLLPPLTFLHPPSSPLPPPPTCPSVSTRTYALAVVSRSLARSRCTKRVWSARRWHTHPQVHTSRAPLGPHTCLHPTPFSLEEAVHVTGLLSPLLLLLPPTWKMRCMSPACSRSRCVCSTYRRVFLGTWGRGWGERVREVGRGRQTGGGGELLYSRYRHRYTRLRGGDSRPPAHPLPAA